MSKTVKILIADDHSVARKGVRALLESQSHFKIVAEAETGMEAIKKAQESQPDVAILDIRMPGESGIEACRQIIKSVEGCKVILLTSYAEDELLFAAIQAGASGYVLKLVGGNELIRAVECVSRGEGFLDSAMISTVFKQVFNASEARHANEFSALTPQEIEVLALVSKGRTNRQIAALLNLGEGTVRNYVSSILPKLGKTNRAGAAAFAIRHNIDMLVQTH